MAETVEERVIEIVADMSIQDKSKIIRRVKLEELNMDSLESTELEMELEEEFEIKIPQEETFNPQTTVGQIVDLVEGLVHRV